MWTRRKDKASPAHGTRAAARHAAVARRRQHRRSRPGRALARAAAPPAGGAPPPPPAAQREEASGRRRRSSRRPFVALQERASTVRRRAVRPRLRRCRVRLAHARRFLSDCLCGHCNRLSCGVNAVWCLQVQRRLVSHRRHLQGHRGFAQEGRIRRRAALSGTRIFVVRRQQRQQTLGFGRSEWQHELVLSGSAKWSFIFVFVL